LDFIPGGSDARGGVGVGTYLGAVLGALAFVALAITAGLLVCRAMKNRVAVTDDRAAELDSANTMAFEEQFRLGFVTQFATTSGGVVESQWMAETFNDLGGVDETAL
jgi:glycerol-3-phosphate acyltransferase PlsY